MPMLGFNNSSCLVVEGLSCPNPYITFWLYTKETRNKPFKLDPVNLQPTQFQPRRPVKVLIHGYTGHRDCEPNKTIRTSFLDHKDYYIISMDYGPLVRDPCYVNAVENVPVASKCLAQLINHLVEKNIVPIEDIHIIGYSLGAHVAGQAANYVKKPLKWITGLDPAKPLFMTVSISKLLDETDAEFVDVIHTDTFTYGLMNAMGHVDFYPNYGLYQPGCKEESDSQICAHERAPLYYSESIHSEKGFWGSYCQNWFFYTIGICAHSEREIMGLPVNKNARGSYFLKTASDSPFALGQLESE